MDRGRVSVLCETGNVKRNIFGQLRHVNKKLDGDGCDHVIQSVRHVMYNGRQKAFPIFLKAVRYTIRWQRRVLQHFSEKLVADLE
jgi:hypothetical protein